MLPRNKRIPRKMFPALMGGKMVGNNLFLLTFVLSSNPSRFSFSVSKKISKIAVIRNKIRRAGYKNIEKYMSRIKTNVLARFSFRRIPKNDVDLDQNLEAALKESNLI